MVCTSTAAVNSRRPATLRRREFLTGLALATAGLLIPARASIGGGLRVFHAGNSFHMRSVPMLAEIAAAAGLRNHRVVGTMLLGGSRAITLWEKPDAQNPAKAALRAGGVDVLTLCPWRQIPDPGVDHFAALAIAHNPAVRLTIQQLSLAFDSPTATNPDPRRDVPDDQKAPTPWDDATAKKLRAIHAEYFRALDAQIAAVNARHRPGLITCVPTGEATIALREKIRLGEAPGLRRQADLFTDRLGHPGPVLAVLNAYAHFGVIYRRSPVGLPAPARIEGIAADAVPPLAALLQRLAWDAVSRHVQAGIELTP